MNVIDQFLYKKLHSLTSHSECSKCHPLAWTYCTDMSASVINNVVNNALFHCLPEINHTVYQMVYVLYIRLVDSWQHHVINLVSQLDCGVDCSPYYASFTLTAGSTYIKPVRPSFNSPTDNTSNWLKVYRVRNINFAAMTFWLMSDDSVILWVVQCNRHIAEHFTFQQVTVACINISWFQLPWCAYKHISNGTVVSHLRCTRTYNDNCLTNVILSLIVKECWKSADISWSYEHDYSGTLFGTHGVIELYLVRFVILNLFIYYIVLCRCKCNHFSYFD